MAEETEYRNISPVLEAYSLAKSRPSSDGKVRLWRVPDLALRSGEFVAVLGEVPSDIRLLLGMLSGLTELTGGVLRVGGVDAHRLSRPQRAKLRAQEIGLVFSQPHLLPDLSVLDNVAFPLRRQGVSRSVAETRGRNLLERVELADRLHSAPGSLDPYEQHLVALARALVTDPQVVLADEPTEGMAPDDSARFMSTLARLCSEEEVALLVGTVRSEIAQSASRTVPMPTDGTVFQPSPGEDLSTSDLVLDVYDHDIWPMLRPVAPLLGAVAKPLAYTITVALLIIFLTFVGMNMAAMGGSGATADWGSGLSSAVTQSTHYVRNLITGNLGSYYYETRFVYWSTERTHTVAEAVARTAGKSLGLLLVSLMIGTIVGVTLGVIAAAVRHRRVSLVFLLLSIAGVSTPSFFLALLLQIAEIHFYRNTGVMLVPVGGFGWDRHLILPAVVLAARPIAQIARVSAVALGEVLDADYVRTARAKGLAPITVLTRHALPNAAVPILTSVGTSLRFSLSSLPVVETLFQWPGMGEMLLMAIRNHYPDLAATLILILGLMFVLLHVFLEHLYRHMDPRMRNADMGLTVPNSWIGLLASTWTSLREQPRRLKHWFEEGLQALAARGEPRRALRPKEPVSDDQRMRDAKIRRERARAWVQSTAGSVPFTVGALVLAVMLAMVIFGQAVAPSSPYSPVARISLDGVDRYAPFPPSATSPMGTDAQGRDILSLLLFGARRTLGLAFFAVVARMILGIVLGALAGWFSGSLLDRALSGLNQVMAAFPSLLLAMLLIYALGIQEGLWVFALALCLVGWGEVSQHVRGQVMRIRQQDYVEGALATGLGDVQLLARHVLPNILPSLVILAFLEMGGVLMLLGELGFIGLFIGGGWATRNTLDAAVTYFDVPEWGVMLSNTWRSFRSQPWMTFYPALTFTVAIIGFNLFGEGLRRLTERLTLSMHRIVNRWTIAAALGLAVLLVAAAEGTGAWPQFVAPASEFSATRAMADVERLASEELTGRAVGSDGLALAAEYIAEQFRSIGLQPASVDDDGLLNYFAPKELRYRSLAQTPYLQLKDGLGQVLLAMAYREDYAEVPDGAHSVNKTQSEVLVLGVNAGAAKWPEGIDAQPADFYGKTLLVTQGLPYPLQAVAGDSAVLVVAPNEEHLTQRQLTYKPSASSNIWFSNIPHLYIAPDVAETILRRSGHSLQEFVQLQASLGANDGFLWRTGVYADATMAVKDIETAYPPYVQAILPGYDEELDNELIILLASYDGQGCDYDGTIYAGANQNASGVSVLLETARLIKEADYQPRRTILFVAWAGAEQHAPQDFAHMLRARLGFAESYRIKAVIELVGLGAGSEHTLVLQRGTSGRLTEVLQQAARRSKVNVSTSGTSMYGAYAYLYPIPDRKIPYVALSWEGSYLMARTPDDTADTVELERLYDAGRVVSLAVMYLGHEKGY